MARNKVKLSAAIEEYLASRTETSLDKESGRNQIVLLFKLGVKKHVKMTSTNIKTIRITLEPGASYFDFPADYLNYTKIGALNSSGKIETLSVNNDIAIAPEYLTDVSGNPLTDSDGIQLTTAPIRASDTSVSYGFGGPFINYELNGTMYNLYGADTDGNRNGYVRINDEFNRAEVSGLASNVIYLEYVADPTMSTGDFAIPEALVEPIKKWVFWQAITGKRGIQPTYVDLARRDYGTAMDDAMISLYPVRNQEIAMAWKHWNKQTPKG